MIQEIITTKNFIYKPFSGLTENERRVIIDCWKNPFCARFNAIKNPSQSVDELASKPEPSFSVMGENSECWFDTNYFRVVLDKNSKEVVGVCRFGMYFEKQNPNVWDFGLFNVVMNRWGEGLGVEILKDVCEMVKSQGIKYLYAGADNDNFGSYRAMIKNGFKYAGLDEDDDFEYRRDLTKPMPREEEIQEEWEKHKRRFIRRFGKKRYERLTKINDLTKEMIVRIKNGEDENKLVQEYYKICNAIEEFPEKPSGE